MFSHTQNEKPQHYRIVEGSSFDTPIRLVDLGSWPRRASIRSAVIYKEWFDWGEVVQEGIEAKLSRIASTFDSKDIFVAGMAYDFAKEFLTDIKIVKIPSDRLEGTYFRAIWDKDAMPEKGDSLALASRMILIWDASCKWMVLNDRYIDLGLFAVFDGADAIPDESIFEAFDKELFAEGFSEITFMDKAERFSEIDKWYPESSRPG